MIGGRDDWPRHLQRLSARLRYQRDQRLAREAGTGGTVAEDDDERLRPVAVLDVRLQSVEACANLLNGLTNLLLPIARARTKRESVAKLAAAAENMGIDRRARSSALGAAPAAADLQALTVFWDGLRQLAEAEETLKVSGAVSPGEFAQLARRLCNDLRLPVERRTGSGVQLLDVYEARETRFRHVFIPGLAEGLFPRRATQEPFSPQPRRRSLG